MWLPENSNSLIYSLLVTQMVMLHAHLLVYKIALDLVCKKCIVYMPENVSHS